MTASFTLAEVDWTAPRDRQACSLVRHTVFVIEQQLPEAEEWDEFDGVSSHVLARDSEGSPIGTARLLPDGSIGRVAVMPQWRGKQVGEALMRAAIESARSAGHAETTVHAQLQAVRFYERLGYEVYGAPFDEAGIPHRHMRLNLLESRGS